MHRALLLLVVVGLMPFAPAGAGTRQIAIEDDAFAPRSVKARPGTTVSWTRGEGSVNEHSVLAKGGFFDSGGPTAGAIDYSVTVSAGSFAYRCEVHGVEGMTGTVRVPVDIKAAPPDLPFTVRWATTGSETGSTYDVQYRIDGGPWRTWKAATGARKGIFGNHGRPICLCAGTKYSIRARSRDGGAASGWSPVRSFTP